MMKAGRELDALVAEKVMGIELTITSQGHPYFRDGTLLRVPIAHYSTDIAAAWQVVEKMRDLGYWCQMRNEFEAHDGPDCWAGFTPHSTTGWNGRPDHWTQAETLPLAICLAALKAVGVLE